MTGGPHRNEYPVYRLRAFLAYPFMRLHSVWLPESRDVSSSRRKRGERAREQASGMVMAIRCCVSVRVVQVLMIIKGLLRRYKRWNPVHPTLGAFWGMGIGLGCGVGWGPGFGPEVVGYVGAGCGIGFSVGITVAGIGIGLPANFLLRIPYAALEGARTGASELARSNALPGMTSVAWDGWNNVAPYVSGLNEARRKLPNLKTDYHLGHGFDISGLRGLNRSFNSCVKSALESLGSLKDRHLPPKP